MNMNGVTFKLLVQSRTYVSGTKVSRALQRIAVWFQATSSIVGIHS